MWRLRLSHPGLGGIAATSKVVIFGDRDLHDQRDVWRCLNTRDGRERWAVTYPTRGNLDYGNTPRATPLISDGRVFCLGASGDLYAVDLASGVTLWKKNFRKDFAAQTELPWGNCGSPLMAAGRLIINPGSPQASIVALDPATAKDSLAVSWSAARVWLANRR